MLTVNFVQLVMLSSLWLQTPSVPITFNKPIVVVVVVLVKVTKGTTEHQKWRKMGQDSVKSSCFPLEGQIKPRLKAKASTGARNRPA